MMTFAYIPEVSAQLQPIDSGYGAGVAVPPGGDVGAPISDEEDSGVGGFIPCEGSGCSFCDFAVLGNNILNWLIGILMVVFAIIVTAAGFGLVTSAGNPEAKTKAKQRMTNAIIGLLIVLAAWLIIDTLMRAVLRGGEGEVGSTPWSTIECTPQTTVNSSAGGGSAGGGSTEPPPSLPRYRVVPPVYDLSPQEVAAGCSITRGGRSTTVKCP